MNTSFDNWSPLFSSLVVSSVWGLEPEAKVVWITLLCLKDRKGFVAGSVPGLARLAVVSVEECEKALKIFESPDPYSKTPDDEGRRIKVVDGGWYVLGHQRFQDHMQKVSTKVNAAKRQRQFRERKKAMVPVAAPPAESRG